MCGQIVTRTVVMVDGSLGPLQCGGEARNLLSGRLVSVDSCDFVGHWVEVRTLGGPRYGDLRLKGWS